MEFRSENREDLVRKGPIATAAVQAVKALKMDFGAVDILVNEAHPPLGYKEEFVVLEVNSMPDISSYDRVSGIRLARLISTWAKGA